MSKTRQQAYFRKGEHYGIDTCITTDHLSEVSEVRCFLQVDQRYRTLVTALIIITTLFAAAALVYYFGRTLKGWLRSRLDHDRDGKISMADIKSTMILAFHSRKRNGSSSAGSSTAHLETDII